MTTDLRSRFRDLHRDGCFVMPNPWDVGSAVRFAGLGFEALATTSSGLAWSLGKDDQEVTRDELLAHVEVMVAAITVPLNVDAERGYAEDPRGVADTIEEIAAAGAAGCSIEDYDPATAAIDAIDVAVERVGAAAEAAHRHDMVLTARAENHLYGVDDTDDTIARLIAYRDAGADVVYAPGPTDLDQIRALVHAVQVPVNVLLRPGGPGPAQLAEVGVRRVSTGGALARVAYEAADAAATALR